MKRLVLGVVLAALAMFVWGILYWAANPWRYSAWHRASNDVAAGKALLESFPENGTYYIPGMYNSKEALPGMFEQGPVAMVHMLRREGRPMMDTSIMAKGLVLYLVVAWLMALLLRSVTSALPSYGARVKFVLLAALAAVLLIDFGDAVWWYIPFDWKLLQAIYNFSAFAVGGLVLAKFVDQRT